MSASHVLAAYRNARVHRFSLFILCVMFVLMGGLTACQGARARTPEGGPSFGNAVYAQDNLARLCDLTFDGEFVADKVSRSVGRHSYNYVVIELEGSKGSLRRAVFTITNEKNPKLWALNYVTRCMTQFGVNTQQSWAVRWYDGLRGDYPAEMVRDNVRASVYEDERGRSLVLEAIDTATPSP